MPELATRVRVLIQEAADKLCRAGLTQPRREALRIWTELSGAGPGGALLQHDSPVEPGQSLAFERAIQRRASGEPLAHVTGWAGFRHLTLRSDRRALIPRPETEGLVELVLQRARSGRIVDVGTGSGCLALSLALEGSFSRVVGVDSSRAAIDLALMNRELLGATGRVDFVTADLCSAIRGGAWDALISNPPYLTVNEYAGLDSSVRDWEPALALVSGADGLNTTTRLLDEARAVLRPGGWLALEVDCTRAALTARLAGEYGWEDVSVYMDLFGRERYLLARRSETR